MKVILSKEKKTGTITPEKYSYFNYADIAHLKPKFPADVSGVF